MILLNVFWAQHGIKITLVSNLTYFPVLSIVSKFPYCAVHTPAFYSAQSHLLWRHQIVIVSQLIYSAMQVSENCGVQTHLLSCADTRLLYGANFAGLLYMAQTRRSLQVSVSYPSCLNTLSRRDRRGL